MILDWNRIAHRMQQDAFFASHNIWCEPGTPLTFFVDSMEFSDMSFPISPDGSRVLLVRLAGQTVWGEPRSWFSLSSTATFAHVGAILLELDHAAS